MFSLFLINLCNVLYLFSFLPNIVRVVLRPEICLIEKWCPFNFVSAPIDNKSRLFFLIVCFIGMNFVPGWMTYDFFL